MKSKTILGFLIVLAVFLLVSYTDKKQAQADGTYAAINTSYGNDAGPDALNFSQGRVWVIDSYGKYIWMTENRSGVHRWAYSNDQGSTWTEDSDDDHNFLLRASVAYDSNNDKLHVIWTANDSNDGIIYRRYGITRDGSNNITDIAREDSGNINLQLDTSASNTLAQPVALWVDDGSTNGILVAIWAKYGTNIAEIRGTMRNLSLSAADGSAANWVAIDGTGDSFATDPPNGSLGGADKIYGTTTNGIRAAAAAAVRGGSSAKKDDLYVFVAQTEGSVVSSYRASWNSSSNNWSSGWQTPISVGNMDVSSGYSLKHELLTKPVFDSTNDRLYIGWARWKDGTNGDTVSLAYLNNSDTASSTYDVYSALSTHAYAPTIDLAYDQTLNTIYAAYVESTTNGTNGSINYKTFDGSTLSSATRFYSNSTGSAGANGGADIPIMYPNRSNNRLLFAFRVNGAIPPTAGEPHIIYFGYASLASPTSTPTPTSTPSPTPVSTAQVLPPVCTDSGPDTAPDLFQIDTTSTSATLYFAPVNGPINYYFFAYGFTPGDARFGTPAQFGTSTGVLSYTINHLSPNTTYYFRIRGGNGCMPGNWGNEMKAKTASAAGRIIRNYRNSSIPVPVAFTSTAQNNQCSHVVKSGDTLWAIAQTYLGNGFLYSQIQGLNPSVQAKYLQVRSTLSLPCNN